MGNIQGNVFFLFIFPFFFLISCTSQPAGKVILTGQLKNGSGEKLILSELDTKTINKIDSVTLDVKGSFQTKLAPSQPGFYLLQAASGKVMVLFIQPDDIIRLQGDFTNFPDFVAIKSNREAESLNDFFRFTHRNERHVDSLENILVEHEGDPDYPELTQQIDTVFKTIWDGQKRYEINYINTHLSSLTSLIVINYAFGMNSVLGMEEDLPLYLKLDSSLIKLYPENKHVKFHHQRVMEHKKV
ncbi:MAG: DUF4369 domain-containing protein [Bacteroidales bacterium]|nr:DUF4369 domain-containing protein [Bacteroidales bacterium]MDD4602946.1 DUF4369 domain-containing protein [Bacteroidales bacterium]